MTANRTEGIATAPAKGSVPLKRDVLGREVPSVTHKDRTTKPRMTTTPRASVRPVAGTITYEEIF